jgi:exonuclease III
LRVATFNANGLQTPGAWRQFLVELDQWVSVHRVSVVIIQEHNWHPDTERDRKAEAAEHRATLTIGFAAEGGSGVHWGGVAILTYDDMTATKSVIEAASDLVSVEVMHGEHVVPIVGVYAPAQPAQRVSMFQTLGPRIPTLGPRREP